MSTSDRDRRLVAKRLRVAREQAGLSQGQVAKLMDWHRPTVSQIEAGQRRVSAEELAKLARLYRVSASWLTRMVDPEEEAPSPQVELAAKELSKLRPDDLDKVIRLLSSIRNGGSHQ